MQDAEERFENFKRKKRISFSFLLNRYFVSDEEVSPPAQWIDPTVFLFFIKSNGSL
ncbi:MAG: hypothetical protein LBF88_06815 [Planctomycetaceae bacterium]|nr:hypothetical protein [Planctomycetaceae bacterium]